MKVREGAVRVKAVYLAIGITMTGEKEVLGLWLAQTEGAKFWLQVVTELRNRGVQDIFIACVDGLKGFPDAIEAVFPKAVQKMLPSSSKLMEFFVSAYARLKRPDSRCNICFPIAAPSSTAL